MFLDNSLFNTITWRIWLWGYFKTRNWRYTRTLTSRTGNSCSRASKSGISTKRMKPIWADGLVTCGKEYKIIFVNSWVIVGNCFQLLRVSCSLYNNTFRNFNMAEITGITETLNQIIAGVTVDALEKQTNKQTKTKKKTKKKKKKTETDVVLLSSDHNDTDTSCAILIFPLLSKFLSKS